MKLSRLISTYSENHRAELWHAIQESRCVRRKKTGTGHATRWWYHEDDVKEFCEKYVKDGVVMPPVQGKLNGFDLFIGPSGSGKTTVMNELQKQYGYVPVASCTDRAPRYENEPGHIFMSEADFDAVKYTVIAPVTFGGHRYGILPESLDSSDMTALEPIGVASLLRACKKKNRPVRIIGLCAPYSELERRMHERGDNETDIKERLANDIKRFDNMATACDIVITNNNLADTVSIVKAVISNWEHEMK